MRAGRFVLNRAGNDKMDLSQLANFIALRPMGEDDEEGESHSLAAYTCHRVREGTRIFTLTLTLSIHWSTSLPTESGNISRISAALGESMGTIKNMVIHYDGLYPSPHLLFLSNVLMQSWALPSLTGVQEAWPAQPHSGGDQLQDQDHRLDP